MVKYKNSNSLNLYYQTSCRLILLFMCNAFSLQAARMYYHNKCSFINNAGVHETRVWRGVSWSNTDMWDTLEDTNGVFIMYHRKSDNYPVMVRPCLWDKLEGLGEVADGVVVVNGENRMLVVAPTETTLQWSSAAVAGGGTTTTDKATALADWNGKANTAAQVKHPECSTANSGPGFCNSYSRTNANGKGLTAGKWWLPSAGELMLIYSNINKINAALKKINGAKLFDNAWYWSSTESDANSAWFFSFENCIIGNWLKKDTSRYNIRPVSAFIV